MASEQSNSLFKRKWFRRRNSNEKNDETLRPADDAYKGDDEFKQRVGDGLVSQALVTKEDIEKEIERSREAIAEEIERAKAANAGWSDARQNGPRKLGSTIQRFITRFANFLTAYSDIVELMKNTSSPYGNVAYGTLSLLFIVVVKKAQNDQKVANVLEQLQYSFPRVNLLSDIYPEPQIETLVAEVYRDVIFLARSAVIYYTETSERVVSAVLPPQELAFNISVENLRQKLAEINLESAVLLHKRAKHIEEQNNELLWKMKRLEDQNDALKVTIDSMSKVSSEKKAQKDRKELANFRELLGVPEACDHTNVQSCRQNLAGAFPAMMGSGPGKFAGRYLQMTPDVLDREESYRAWLDCTHSCLLILSGTSVMEGRTNISTCSWLSPAAIYVTERQLADKKSVAFHCCHPQHLAKKSPVQEAILSLACQVLAWKPEILRQNPRFQTLARKTVWSEESEEMLKTMFEVLNDLLTEIGSKEPVYIILDRADQCAYRPFTLLKRLVGVIQKASCRVKVMLVIDSAHLGFDSSLCEDLKQESNGYIVGRLDWDQHRLGQQDLLQLHRE